MKIFLAAICALFVATSLMGEENSMMGPRIIGIYDLSKNDIDTVLGDLGPIAPEWRDLATKAKTLPRLVILEQRWVLVRHPKDAELFITTVRTPEEYSGATRRDLSYYIFGVGFVGSRTQIRNGPTAFKTSDESIVTKLPEDPTPRGTILH